MYLRQFAAVKWYFVIVTVAIVVPLTFASGVHDLNTLQTQEDSLLFQSWHASDCDLLLCCRGDSGGACDDIGPFLPTMIVSDDNSTTGMQLRQLPIRVLHNFAVFASSFDYHEHWHTIYSVYMQIDAIDMDCCNLHTNCGLLYWCVALRFPHHPIHLPSWLYRPLECWLQFCSPNRDCFYLFGMLQRMCVGVLVLEELEGVAVDVDVVVSCRMNIGRCCCPSPRLLDCFEPRLSYCQCQQEHWG